MWNVISTESSTLNSFFYKYAILRAYKIYLVHYLPIYYGFRYGYGNDIGIIGTWQKLGI